MRKKAFLVLFLTFVFTGRAFSALTADINHSHIKIDFLYHGSTVSVKGTKDKGTDLIIKIASSEGHESLRKKGKVAGLLWMNVGQVKIENVPVLYSIHSTRDINEILKEEEMNANGIGYLALKNSAKIEGVDEKDKWFSEFIKYKEASGLYWTTKGKIQVTQSSNDDSYQAIIDWPYQAQPSQYKITVYAVKDGVVLEKAEKTLLVEQVGIVKALADMAKNNGALYGIISIVIALGAGFGVGLIFRKGGGAH